MISKAYLVLPKEEVYRYKEDNVKREIEVVVKFWYKLLSKTKLRICCFAEDKLALELLGTESNICWYSVLDESDLRFMDKSLHEVTEKYRLLPKKRVREELIQEAIEKYKPGNPRSIPPAEYRQLRQSVLRKRIRYVCNKTLEETAVVIFIDANNNYCNLPEPKLGNGQLLSKVSYLTNVSDYSSIGGIHVNREVFITALEGMYANNV